MKSRPIPDVICEHVPELAMLFAKAAHETGKGRWRVQQMSDKDRRELWTAGLLHDCGRSATPVHIVEKSTKLEAIYDRVHTIDTRIEILKRDARSSLAGGSNLALGANPMRRNSVRWSRRIATNWRRWTTTAAAVRLANAGSERMAPELQERISEDCVAPMARTDGTVRLAGADEVTNLLIRRPARSMTRIGRSLTTISFVTIKMLESLPWPKHLQRVPEYAAPSRENGR